MEILQDECHGSPLAQATQHPEDRFKGPRLASFRGARHLRDALTEASREVWQEAHDIRDRRTEHRRKVMIVERMQRWSDGPHDRPVGVVRTAWPGAAAQDGPRFGELRDARHPFVQEAGHAHTGRPAQDQSPGTTAGRTVQHGRKARERDLTPHEPRARIAGGHAGILGATLADVTDGPSLPHPANGLNDLTGEAWLYFTKSVLTTAYPSELGHAARKAHGANKPPRLMARLIEFFSKTGELVLDPFAGVGGTLLGASIARGPRRSIGIELEQRWADVYESLVPELLAERDGLGPVLTDLGTADPGVPRTFDPSGATLLVGDSLAVLPTLDADSIDLVATDPPYNVQLPLTMAGGPLAATHANRRTDYAMVGDLEADLANAPDYATFLDRMESVFVELHRVLRDRRYLLVIVRDAYQDGRYVFTGSDLAGRAGRVGFVPKGDLIWYQAGSRLRPYGYPRVFVPNIVHQHILVFRKEPPRAQSSRSREAR